jgi:3-hydroxybutyrate dehydrogenase
MFCDLSQKVAVISGSTSGIGLAIAKKLASKNAHIVLHGIEEESSCLSLIEDIKKLTKGDVIYCRDDVSTMEGAFSLMDKAIKRFDKVDILVNNACIQHVSSIEDFPVEKWNYILNISVSATFYATQKVLPLMRANNWGRIINIASVHGVVASVNKAAYVTAKHGILGLTKVIGLETAKENITCNAICPGWVLTPLVEKQILDRAALKGTPIDEEQLALLSEKQPSQQFVKPEDIGEMVLFLCSDAASQITGTDLKIDGGWTAQ